jgi:fermentation-respiration switch protein FrsA (DUF1100 family)
LSPVSEAPDAETESTPSLLRAFMKWAMLAALLLLLLVVLLVALRPETLLFYPSSKLEQTPEAIGWDYERLELETEDGETIVGWYLPAEPGLLDRPQVVLYCHGNGGNIGGRIPVLEGLRSLGLAVLIFDYRGYGESSGRPTVTGTRLDVITAWRYLVDERGYAPEDIVLWGRSLGGAVAIDQAARLSEAGMAPAALVVESSFTSTVDIGREVYPWLPIAWFAGKIDYPSQQLITEVEAPILLAHSPEDELIPASHGQRLREAAEGGAAPRVGFVELRGGHNEGHLAQRRHIDAVAAFLRGG